MMIDVVKHGARTTGASSKNIHDDYFQLHLIFIIVKEFEEPVKKLEIIVNNCQVARLIRPIGRGFKPITKR